MNKKEILEIIGALAAGIAVGTAFQYKYDQKRINRFRPLLVNALGDLLVDVHTNPDQTAEEIRTKTAVELEFIKIAMK
jgi:hypothetical protein